jgi:hypothetical protein
MTVTKIISGGQTGADQGALAAARELSLETGGCMPLGFKTESGPNRDLAIRYGLRQHHLPTYPPRTRDNVAHSDGTLIFGNPNSPGSKLTRRICEQLGKYWYILYWSAGQGLNQHHFTFFPRWLDDHRIEILNVAGNRESIQPGVHDAVYRFLVAVFREHK